MRIENSLIYVYILHYILFEYNKQPRQFFPFFEFPSASNRALARSEIDGAHRKSKRDCISA